MGPFLTLFPSFSFPLSVSFSHLPPSLLGTKQKTTQMPNPTHQDKDEDKDKDEDNSKPKPNTLKKSHPTKDKKRQAEKVSKDQNQNQNQNQDQWLFAASKYFDLTGERIGPAEAKRRAEAWA
jgi:hypothetical protein